MNRTPHHLVTPLRHYTHTHAHAHVHVHVHAHVEHVRNARGGSCPLCFRTPPTETTRLPQRRSGPTAHADRTSRSSPYRSPPGPPEALPQHMCEQTPRERHAPCAVQSRARSLEQAAAQAQPSPASPARTTVAMSGPGDNGRARDFRGRSRVRVGRCVRG